MELSLSWINASIWIWAFPHVKNFHIYQKYINVYELPLEQCIYWIVVLIVEFVKNLVYENFRGPQKHWWDEILMEWRCLCTRNGCLPKKNIVTQQGQHLRPTNEPRRYIVTSSLIGWVYTQNDPCRCFPAHEWWHWREWYTWNHSHLFECYGVGGFLNNAVRAVGDSWILHRGICILGYLKYIDHYAEKLVVMWLFEIWLLFRS